MRGRVAVVAVALAGGEAVAVAVVALVDQPVAVLVHAVAQLGRARVHRGVPVVAVAVAGRDAVAVAVVQIVHDAIAVGVDAVAVVRGARPDGGVGVVAVAVDLHHPVPVVVDRAGQGRREVVDAEAVLGRGGEEVDLVHLRVEPQRAEHAAVDPLPVHVHGGRVGEHATEEGLDQQIALPVHEPAREHELGLVEADHELGLPFGIETDDGELGAARVRAEGLGQHDQGVRGRQVQALGRVLLGHGHAQLQVLEVHDEGRAGPGVVREQRSVGSLVEHDGDRPGGRRQEQQRADKSAHHLIHRRPGPGVEQKTKAQVGRDSNR